MKPFLSEDAELTSEQMLGYIRALEDVRNIIYREIDRYKEAHLLREKFKDVPSENGTGDRK